MSSSPLPIDDVLPQLLAHLRARGAVVLKAPPGAGKTTRVPPAMLDAGLADLPNGRPGRIILLQPRRVAARASAARIAEERGGEVGDEIGYQVRFERRASGRTRILVCTEGVFLRQLQNDPFLDGVAAVVFDEFHERSLDSDLALAMVRRVREEVRPDLRLVVMSATLAAAPIARYLDDCPTVESVGRAFPVDVEYLRLPSNDSIERLVVDGVQRLLTRTRGDLLVFLPGVGEINRVQSDLEATAAAGDFALLPLYGDMPLDEQQRVLRPTLRRKVVLATNVAETSLTIDGVTGVVDSGWARVNQYDAQLGLNRLDTVRISHASSEQRAGRAGRTAPGVCFRLWTEREQNSLRAFERPEIERVDLSEALLQLLAWGESDVRAFPWYEPPPSAAVEQALALLDALDAISDGKVTDLGRALAKLPLQPRLARLLLEGERLGAPQRAALAAAMLSERDPFRRRGPRFKAEHHTDSDTLDRLAAIEAFERSGRRDSQVGELLIGPAKQMLRARDQLLRSVDSGSKQGSAEGDDAVLRALAVAFPDRICKRREPKGRRGVMVGGRGVRLADESAVADAELFVAVELTESGQAETLVRQASLVERTWLPETHLQTKIEVAFDVTREKVMGVRRTKFLDLILEETPAAIPRDVDCGPILAAAVAERYDPTMFIDDDARRYLARLRCLREWLPQMDWPDFGAEPWREVLPGWCAGLTGVADLRAHSPVRVLQARLTSQQLAAVEREAPERIAVPSGSRITLEYEVGKPPILAVRIQELFGLRETPRVGGGRIPVLLQLLAPNYRVQQITPDLASFWKNTYAEVKKELKRRYPKHAWPDDPTAAQAIAGPVKRKPETRN
ncbi:MAG: ATP-dependent helicase HrpB [Planctomycetia bacterium]|nr:ATP-dependent helicase HrpB [Planctomycetia bacterium]